MFQRNTFSGNFFVGYSRICGSIQRRNVWGYKLVCDSCEEGHHHAKRHATCTTNKRGVSFDAELMYSRRSGDWGVDYWVTRCDVEWLACSNLHDVRVTNNWNPMPLQFWIKIWDWHTTGSGPLMMMCQPWQYHSISDHLGLCWLLVW